MPQPTVLITGYSKGSIGDAMARAFAAQGYHVFAAVRDITKATHFTEHAHIDPVMLDVTSYKSIAALAVDLHSRLDISDDQSKLGVLVNNVGCLATGPLLDANPGDVRRVYDVNVLDLLEVTQAFAPMVIAANGHVVNVSSQGSLLAMPWAGLCYSSKATVTILSETLSLELAPLGVTVITAMLGNIESNVHSNDAWQGLSEAAPYKTVEPQIAKIATSDISPKKENVDKSASRFVGDITGGAYSQIWRGAMDETTRLMGYYLPASLLVGFPPELDP